MLSQTENVEEEGGRQIFFYSGNKNWKMMISFWIVQEWEMNKKKKNLAIHSKEAILAIN